MPYYNYCIKNEVGNIVEEGRAKNLVELQSAFKNAYKKSKYDQRLVCRMDIDVVDDKDKKIKAKMAISYDSRASQAHYNSTRETMAVINVNYTPLQISAPHTFIKQGLVEIFKSAVPGELKSNGFDVRDKKPLPAERQSAIGSPRAHHV